MTFVLELIPISTLIAIITTQVLETATAAQDVLIEKESFRVLAKYIQDVQPLLQTLKQRDMNDSMAIRTALTSLQDDLKKADILIHNCSTKAKMYLLVHCRSIVCDAQQIIRDLGESLRLISLASCEVDVDIGANLNRLSEQMKNAQLQASESKLMVINKLEQGLRDHRTDRGFANDLIEEIARAVGIPVDASELRKELTSFKKEKEEAAAQKKLEEEAFMAQVITLLSRADAAQQPPESPWTFLPGRVDRRDITSTELIPPFKSFVCPLKQDVMDDPVSLATGSCYERSCIQKWLEEGHSFDPVTHEELDDWHLRPNVSIRQSIEEWQERNYCIGILKAKEMLQSGDESKQLVALADLSQLIGKIRVNQDWITNERLVDDLVKALKSSSPSVKHGILSVMLVIVQNDAANKESLADAGGLEQIVRCLGRDTNVAKAATALLLEILDGNDKLSARIGQERSAILLLVTLLSSKDDEAVQLARLTLDKLSDLAENVVQMAASNWCTPLISRLCEGKDEESKVVIVKALGTLPLTEENKVSLGQQGAIAPLVQILNAGKLEVKLAALSALQNLSTLRLIKNCIAEAGAIPIILNHLFSHMSTIHVREAAAAITCNVATNHGATFFVDSHGVPLDLKLLIENLLAEQENALNHQVIRTHIFGTLLGFVAVPGGEPRTVMRKMRAVSRLLPLIAGPHGELRNYAVQILYHLSDGDGREIAEYVLKHQKFRTILKLLNDNMSEEVRGAVAGIVASFPVDSVFTAALIEADAVSALLPLLQTGSPLVKEAAMGALIRFTESSDIGMQHTVARQNIHPILAGLVCSGTVTCRARAAVILRNFSRSTPQLSLEPNNTTWMCFHRPKFTKCAVHRGKCSVKGTFCLVEADAVGGLIALVNDDRGAAALAGLEALETLLAEDILQSGAQFLHDVNGIVPIVDKLSSPELKDKSLAILERILRAKGMKEEYGVRCKIPLVEIASSGSSSAQKQAARVLAQLRFIDVESPYN